MPGETTFGDAFRLTLITDDAATARDADLAGVNRIGIDLERLGKAERQAGKDSWVSHHTLEDLANIRPSVLRAQLFARVNPIHRGTQSEIESALELGAAVLMLPNFHSTSEVQNFIDAVRGRAWTIVLIESTAALTRIREILAIPGIDEVMVGLNDLHIQLRVSNHFEVLASPLLDMVKCEVRRAGLSWSIGGVGRVGDLSLPVPADLVHAQYPRLEATGAWLSRSFINSGAPLGTLQHDVRALRECLSRWAAASPEALQQARQQLARCANQWTPWSGRG